ncbi:MAG: ABC transporter substrate-binding protein [Acidaminobacteraceae bacterium]
MKKTLALLLTLLMVTISFAACAKEVEPVVEEEMTEVVAEEMESTEPTRLVISTWGYNEDILRKNVFAPFEEANNVEIVLEVGNNSDRLNKIRTIENSEIDLIFLAESFAIQGVEEGLFETIDRANIPNVENIYEVAKAPHGMEYGPAYTLNRTGIIYDSAMVDFEVTSWSDLWNNSFESNLAIPEITTTAGPPMVLVAADYASVDALTDVDAAFAKLVELKPNLVKTYGRSSELVNMFIQGEIVIGVAQDFAFGNIKEAIPTAMWVNPSEGAFVNLNTINIIKGSKNKELSEKLINFWLSEEVQMANAIDKVDSPINTNVILTEEEASGLTYGSELIDSLKVIDWKSINVDMANWIDKWNREVSN